MNKTSDNLVLCAVYPDAPTASLAIGLLAANGIQSIADNATISTILPVVGGIRVMVRERDLNAARAALRAGDMLQ
ncbi:MAG: DUF2007 domain-containing protein [Muribaculaceae bacterium]|nr:DUF2007 domain-containing protein [Muribaculaceae bacterium]